MFKQELTGKIQVFEISKFEKLNFPINTMSFMNQIHMVSGKSILNWMDKIKELTRFENGKKSYLIPIQLKISVENSVEAFAFKNILEKIQENNLIALYLI